MQSRQKLIGIPWFGPDTYQACRAVMTDGEDMPDYFPHWLADAEELLAEVEEAGHRALRVPIDPKEFVGWCRARHLQPDAKARVRFAKQVAFQEAGFTNGGTGRGRR
ncbi:MAG TPA: hypothetical protein VGM68_13250 [Rhizomicrobium sp.]|jgi:hypothetical protein